MAILETLKGCLMLLGVLALLINVLIGAEFAFMKLVMILDEFRERNREKRQEGRRTQDNLHKTTVFDKIKQKRAGGQGKEAEEKE